MAAVSIPIFPACEPAMPKVYSNLPLEFRDYKLIERFTRLILPIDPDQVTTPESTVDFILSHVNDCRDEEEQQIFLEGLQEIHLHLSGGKKDKKIAFHKKSEEKQANTLDFVVAQANDFGPIKFFYDSVRDLTLKHFTSSEYFMKNYLDFEFIPGRFKGCVPV